MKFGREITRIQKNKKQKKKNINKSYNEST